MDLGLIPGYCFGILGLNKLFLCIKSTYTVHKSLSVLYDLSMLPNVFFFQNFTRCIFFVKSDNARQYHTAVLNIRLNWVFIQNKSVRTIKIQLRPTSLSNVTVEN